MSSSSKRQRPAEEDLWKSVDQKLKIMKAFHPNDHGLRQLELEREQSVMMLMVCAEVLNIQFKNDPGMRDKAIPPVSWATHKACVDMGLGPVPDDAFLNPHGQRPNLLTEAYSQKLLEIYTTPTGDPEGTEP